VTRRDDETYEYAIVSTLRERLQQGDDVVIVGGGWGVTTVVAARAVGPDGSVVTVEGSLTFAERVRETVELNGVSDRVEIREAVVSRDVSVWGDGDSEVIPPSSLPSCDVLELDCEGAELDILSEMERRPRMMVVECHGALGSPTDAVADRLSAMGYEVVGREPAEQGPLAELCVQDDIHVLTDVRA